MGQESRPLQTMYSTELDLSAEPFRKIALFGGVYNNYLALEALLDKCRRQRTEAIFCLGDIGGFGPHPDRCFPLLRNGNILNLAGNYDVSLAQGNQDCGCGYTDPRDNHFAQISYNYTFAKTSAENKAWLDTLPASIRLKVGSRTVALCHGSPRRTNEFLWESTSPDHLLEKFLRDWNCDALVCTHTGIKWRRKLPRGGDVINTGVIGRPENDGQTHVWYSTLEDTPAGLHCEFYPLIYDYRRLADEMRLEKLPSEFIETVVSGWWTTCLEVLPGKERCRGRY